MSRIGKLPVNIPQGVKASLAATLGVGTVSVEGPLGKLDYTPRDGVTVMVEAEKILVKPSSESKQAKANYGTTRSHIANMVLGVSKGWKKSLEMTGVGYTAKLQGQQLVLTVGFSHDVVLDIPKVVKCTVSKTVIDLQSCDKEVLGLFAARIHKVKPPEPYLGKGIRYSDEVVRRKAGKTGKK